MKRNPKAFSFEIKKSRAPGQHHRPASRRLFETFQVETLKTFQKQEIEAAAEPEATRRILPSILKPISSSSEPVEPVRRKQSSRRKASQAQIEFALSETTSETVKDQPAETQAISEAVSHAGYAPVAEADLSSVPKAQPRGAATGRARTSRSKSPEANAQAIAFKSIVEPKHAPESEMIDPNSVVSSQKTGQSRLTKRQIAAAQLPRHERWKRRLHSAAW